MTDNKSIKKVSTTNSGTHKFSEGQKPASIQVRPMTMQPGATPPVPKK
jgi:hypothetical protein